MTKQTVRLEIWKEPGDDRISVKLLDTEEGNIYYIHSRRNYGSPLLYKALKRILETKKA